MKRDYSISLIRVFAMFFIVFCHVATQFGQDALGQFFNVGIYIFFMISGYLYGDKTVKTPGYWLYKRYIRLEIPALIWFVMLLIFNYLRGLNYPELHHFIFLLLNLQGLNFIFYSMRDLFIGPWFFTNIMCCYILLLCYLRIEEKHPGVDHIFDYGGIIPLAIFVLLSLCNIGTAGALAFFIGFRMKRKKLLAEYRKKDIVVAIVCFAVAVSLRLAGKHFIDGTLFYDGAIAQGTHVMIAAAFIVGVKWSFGALPNLVNSVARSKIVQHLDKISIYVYVCHDRTFGVLSWPIPLIISFMLMIVFSVMLATFLWYVGEYLTKQIDRSVHYLFV